MFTWVDMWPSDIWCFWEVAFLKKKKKISTCLFWHLLHLPAFLLTFLDLISPGERPHPPRLSQPCLPSLSSWSQASDRDAPWTVLGWTEQSPCVSEILSVHPLMSGKKRVKESLMKSFMWVHLLLPLINCVDQAQLLGMLSFTCKVASRAVCPKGSGGMSDLQYSELYLRSGNQKKPCLRSQPASHWMFLEQDLNPE